MTLWAWLREHFATAPLQRGPVEVPTSSMTDRFIAERRNEDAATIRLRMQARVQLLDAEAELIGRDSSD